MYTDTSVEYAECQSDMSVSLEDSEPLMHRLMRQFTAAVQSCPDRPTPDQFGPAKKAYGRLIRCLSPDQHSALWEAVTVAKRAGAKSELMVFVRFSKLRTHVFHQSEKYKEQQAEYDRKRKLDPKRQQQIKEAKARSRAKARKAAMI